MLNYTKILKLIFFVKIVAISIMIVINDKNDDDAKIYNLNQKTSQHT